MITSTSLARVVAGSAVLLAVTPAFAQAAKPEHQERKKMENTKCPVISEMRPANARHTASGAMSNRDWWPNQLNLRILHQNSPKGNPMGAEFNYAAEFQKLDLKALKDDLRDPTKQSSLDVWPSQKYSAHFPPQPCCQSASEK